MDKKEKRRQIITIFSFIFIVLATVLIFMTSCGLSGKDLKGFWKPDYDADYSGIYFYYYFDGEGNAIVYNMVGMEFYSDEYTIKGKTIEILDSMGFSAEDNGVYNTFTYKSKDKIYCEDLKVDCIKCDGNPFENMSEDSSS